MIRQLLSPHRFAAATLLLLLATAGCDDDGGLSVRNGPLPDVASNGRIRVDEAALHATVKSGALRVEVPVQALRSGDGELLVALLGVDGTAKYDTLISFDLDQGKSDTLIALLPLPADLKDQADHVRYSVRVQAEPELRVTKSLLYTLSPYELRIEGPATVKTTKTASYRARMHNPVTHAPLAETEVTLSLSLDGAKVHELTAETDETGSAIFELDVEQAGAYELSASTTEDGAPLTLVENVTAEEPGQKLLVTTDKPIYQPGQTLHLRALALESPKNTPVAADTEVTFELEDGKGNKILKKAKKTDAYGIASLDFQLANLVNMGTFKVRALAGEATGEKTVEVSRYVLPKFDVKIQTASPWYTAAAKVTGTVDARYFFGKDLAAASVVIEALTLDVGENVFERVMGKTDAQGHMGFSLTLPQTLAGIPLQNGNALVTLRVTVTDSAGQEVKKELALTVAAAAVQLSAIPEASVLVPGIENRVHVFATDPLGAPVSGATIAVAGQTEALTTDGFGHAELRFTPASADTSLALSVTTLDGETASENFTFESQSAVEHVLVRTDKSVYAVGETVKVQVLTDKDESRVYVDWLNEGQAIDMRTLDAAGGTVSFSLPADATMLGENRIEAYVVDVDGNIARAGRTVLVNQDGALSVELSTDAATYAPGAPAKLTFQVTDKDGKPAVAALGVQIVDEAVFGLIDARPGLLRTYFELEEAFAKPSYEIHAPAVSFEKLIFEDVASQDAAQAKAAQTQTEAQLAALGGKPMMGLSVGSWTETRADAGKNLESFYEAEKKRLIALMKPNVERAVGSLAADGCMADQYWCESLQLDYGQALSMRLGEQRLSDFWGVLYEYKSEWGSAPTFSTSGPDERKASGDEHQIVLEWSAFGADVWSGGEHGADGGVSIDDCVVCGGGGGEFPGSPDNGGAGAAGGGAPEPTEPDNDGSSSGEPRVRREFPETLYVNPALITDGDGKATVALDMADSITSWRVSALANSKTGQLGGGRGAITVFQDFFVDVSFPAELTRGDEVQFPIVVYNYLKVAQQVKLEVEAASWFTAQGGLTATLDLEPNEVRAVRIPVKVQQVGTQTLTVRAYGTKLSDAVARTVRVVPDGLAVPLAQSGSLAMGTKTLTASFPLDAVPGSQLLYLDVFPAFLAQAVQGLDSILAEPSGCFEQTTSTTWPNVLVTRYMEETGQVTPEIQLKAEALISAGYQRLLTFEHSGGGFSWFGESDGAPFLSVTAFGLMEFADMAKVQHVDPAMLERTQAWLLAQQKADGSWEGDQSEFFSFQTSAARNTAFTLWALAQYGYSGAEMQAALDYVQSEVKETDDPYTLALAANAFALAAPNDAFLGDLLDWIEAKKQVTDGKISWDTDGTQTNFYGAGNDSTVSTTALVTHALLQAGGHATTVKGAIDFITASKDTSGNFGSTQATVWALKTLLLAALKGTEGAVGTLDVSLDGQPFTSVELTPDQADVMTRVDMSSLATTGAHQVTLSFAGTGKVSYNLVSSHHLPWASVPVPPSGPLSVAISYDRTTLALDETVAATVTVENQLDKTQNMILVTVGIPPGFELLTEDLDAYVTAGTLSRYEKTGKQLILYMTELAPSATQQYTYRLRATMPVVAADGGAEVHPYYEPNQTSQSKSTTLSAHSG